MMLNRVHRASSVRGTPALTRPRCLVVSRSSNWFGAFVNGSKPKPKEAVEVEPTKSETTAETEVVHAPSGRLMPPRNRDFLEAKQVSLYQMFDSDEMR